MKALQKEIFGEQGKKMETLLRREMAPRVQEASMEMLHEFDMHPITIELNAGPSASNISGTLGGYGNLFSFIGFEAGDDPIEPLRRVLQRKMAFKVNKVNDKGKFAIIIDMPSKDEMYAVTPIPWLTGRSWIDGIERGLSGLGSYVYKKSPNSRSGTGIQSSTPIRGGRLQNSKYLSEILRNFQKNLFK